MNIISKLFGIKDAPPPVRQGIILDPPKVSLRQQVLNFAAVRPNGFIDDELVDYFGDDMPRTTALTPRVNLLRDGLLFDSGEKRRNANGNLCAVYKSAIFSDKPIAPAKKRIPYSQLVIQNKALHMRVEQLQQRINELEAHTPIVAS